MTALRAILLATVLAAGCGNECGEDQRECTDDRGRTHCVWELTDCPSHIVCEPLECVEGATDQCTDLVDTAHCGECWRACPTGTYCNIDAECVPIVR